MALRLPELIVIFVVALLIFGPKKLPEMGAQIGRSINAFKKGMSEFNRSTALDEPFDSDSFLARHNEITALEARRLELEIREREIKVKTAEAALRAAQEGRSPYSVETTVEQDYIESETVVDADSMDPEERNDAFVEADEADSTPVEADESNEEIQAVHNVAAQNA